MIARIINLPFKRNRVFLFGPRQVGKSTLVRQLLSSGDLTGLKLFMKDYSKAKPLCVSTCDEPYMAGTVSIIPWKYLFRKDFLDLV
jgi:predicted AAA+ superfamily ATPase